MIIPNEHIDPTQTSAIFIESGEGSIQFGKKVR